MLSLNDKSTWLLNNDENHWSTTFIMEKVKQNRSFRFDTLSIYSVFNYEGFLKHWSSLRMRKNPLTIVTRCSQNQVIQFDNSIINMTFGERLNIGWYNSHSECAIKKGWCPSIFLVNDDSNPLPKEYKIMHFSRVAFIKIMNPENSFGNSIQPLLCSSPPTVADVTSLSCIKCKNPNDNETMVHICNKVNFVSETKIYVCGLFEKQFDLTSGEELFDSNKNLTLDNKNEEYSFFVVKSPQQQNGGKT